MGIVFHNGKPLFRDGKIATSTNCCCVDIPCCGPCAFPVSDPTSMGSALDLGNGLTYDPNSPSIISNFQYRYQYLIGGIPDSVAEQSGPSLHVSVRIPYPTYPGFRVIGRCRWFIPLIDPNDPYGTPVYIEGNANPFYAGPVIGDSYRWDFSVFNQGLFPGADPPDPTLFVTSVCSGTISWDYTFWTPLSTVRNVGSFEISGGRKWPPGFYCQDSVLRYNGRNATATDLPDGYL